MNIAVAFVLTTRVSASIDFVGNAVIVDMEMLEKDMRRKSRGMVGHPLLKLEVLENSGYVEAHVGYSLTACVHEVCVCTFVFVRVIAYVVQR